MMKTLLFTGGSGFLGKNIRSMYSGGSPFPKNIRKAYDKIKSDAQNNFNETEFFLDSVMGPILIKGENLELLKLDTFQGNISIN